MNEKFLYRGRTKQRDIYGREEKETVWFVGSLLWYNEKEDPQIWTVGEGGNYIVDRDTVGQCTGLRDKKGELLFEGDIVKNVCGDCVPIVWVRGSFIIYYDEDVYEWSDLHSMVDNSACEIWALEKVGNVYDNPELIKYNERTVSLDDF